MRRRSLLTAALLSWPLLRAMAQDEPLLPLASDLRGLGATSRRTQQPIVLLFSTPGCPYCRDVRRNYLAPMLAAGTPVAPAPLIQEVVITSSAALVDFDGRALTHAQFAERRGVSVSPVVMALDGRGQVIGEPLVGLDAAGFYNAYLEALLARARAQVRTPAPATR